MTVLLGACGPGLQRIDDEKLAGVPLSNREALHEARKQLALARVDLEKARDAATEAEYRLKVVKAALEVAEARSRHTEVEFEFAKWKKDSKAIVTSGEGQRSARETLERTELERDLAETRLELTEAQVLEAERKVFWLDAEHELEKARLAQEHGAAGELDKQAFLQPFEQAALKAKLDLSDATGARISKQALVTRSEDKIRMWETGKK